MRSDRTILSRPVVALALGLALALTALPATASTWEIDPVHSSAVFKINHFQTANFYGMFHGIKGTLNWDPEAAEPMSIEVAVAAESVDTGNSQRDDHIKSPDFLNAKQFPAITFKSTSVKPTGDRTFEVKGDLTMLGVTHEVTVQAEKVGQGTNPRSNKEIVGFETRFTVDRTNYDMGFMAGPLGKDIEFILSVEAVKQ